MNWPALLLAFALGVAVMGALILFVRADVLAKYDEAQTISDGAAELLEVLAEAGLVINAENTVVRATTSAMALGLVRNRALVQS